MSLPPYPNYKDSGVEWLGEVPGHWGVARLRHVCFCLDGRRVPLNSSERADRPGGIPYWGANSIVGYVDEALFDEDLVLLGEDGAPFFDQSKPVAFYSQGKVWPNNHVHVLRPVVAETGRFITHVLNITDYSQFIDGSTRDKLTQGSMNDIPFPWPSVVEQTQIAAFLDRETAKIDELVAEQRRLMELLKEKRQAVISHAVTRGLNPDAPMKPSGIEWLGDVPEHWEVKQIRQFVEILRGKFTHRPRNDPAFYDGDYPFIQTGDVTGTSRFITEYKQTLNERGISVSKQFPKGTLVMTIAANIGDVAVLDFPAYFPDSIVGLVPSQKSELMFLFYLMMAMKQPLEMNATVSTQMNLNVEQIGSLSSACPPLKEQRAIVVHLDKETAKLDTLTTESQRAITLLQERRTALISTAVTGQIDVRGAVAA